MSWAMEIIKSVRCRTCLNSNFNKQHFRLRPNYRNLIYLIAQSYGNLSNAPAQAIDSVSPDEPRKVNSEERIRVKEYGNSQISDSIESENDPWEAIRKNDHIYKGICPWKSKEELANTLCANILYESHGIIAMNKPFGVGVLNLVRRASVKRAEALGHGQPDPKKSEIPGNLYHTRGIASTHYTLEDIVPLLRERLGLPELQLVKSPEKYSSGVAVFGVNETISQQLVEALKKTKLMSIRSSNYLMVTTNIPKINEVNLERVGITIKTNEATGSRQPVIEKTFSKQSMYHCIVYPAHVELSLHSSNRALGVACVELQTDLTKWNFLRVYSAHALMPLLGDHLFSARVQSVMGVKIALPPLSIEPGTSNQKLSNEVLKALSLRRPEDSLIVPLHVHLQSFTISRFFPKSKNRKIILKAPPQPFFEWTCNRLGLTKVEKT